MLVDISSYIDPEERESIFSHARFPLRPRIKDYKELNIIGLNDTLDKLQHDITIFELNNKTFKLHIGVVDLFSDEYSLDIPNKWFPVSGERSGNTRSNLKSTLRRVGKVRKTVFARGQFDYYTDMTEIDKIYGHHIVTEAGYQCGPNDTYEYEEFQFIQAVEYLRYIKEILLAECDSS